MSPADLFNSANSPMGPVRLWITWLGMAVFIALIFSVLRDAMRRQRSSPLTIGLAALVVVALLLVFLLPR